MAWQICAASSKLFAKTAPPLASIRYQRTSWLKSWLLGGSKRVCEWAAAIMNTEADRSTADFSDLRRDDRASAIALAEALHSAWRDGEARQLTQALANDARRQGSLADLRYILAIAFSIEFVAGRADAARLAATEELAIATDCGLRRERKEALGHLAWCEAFAGHADECRRLAEERRNLMRRMGSDSPLHGSVGVLNLADGRLEMAIALFRESMADEAPNACSQAGAIDPVVPDLIEALFRSGRRGRRRPYSTPSRQMCESLAVRTRYRWHIVAAGSSRPRPVRRGVGGARL